MGASFRWKIAQAAEIRWWKRYLSNKEPADYLEKKKAYWWRILRQLELSPPWPDPVLEVGCGPAGMFLVLEKTSVVAVDPLLSSYEALPHFQPEAYPQVTFLERKLEDFSADASFELIFCLNCINHVDDLTTAIRQLYAACAPGGRLVLSVDVHRHSWLQPIFYHLPGDILHPHQYTRAQYEAQFLAEGFSVQRQFSLKQGRIFNDHIWILHKALP